jgi:hypothetical protein
MGFFLGRQHASMLSEAGGSRTIETFLVQLRSLPKSKTLSTCDLCLIPDTHGTTSSKTTSPTFTWGFSNCENRHRKPCMGSHGVIQVSSRFDHVFITGACRGWSTSLRPAPPRTSTRLRHRPGSSFSDFWFRVSDFGLRVEG